MLKKDCEKQIDSQGNHHHMHVWLRQHSFLLRLLITTLIAGCIPLIIVSSILISRENNNIIMSAKQQIASIASLTAIQFDKYIDVMANVNLKMQTSDKLFERVISSSVRNELEALEFIDFMQGSLPFTVDYGLFINGDQSVYSNTGKYKASVYARYIIGIDEPTFIDIMQSVHKSVFLPISQISDRIVFAMPIRTGSSSVIKKVSLYVISPNSLISSMEQILTDRYKLAAIFDPDNNLIFNDKNCPFDFNDITETNMLFDLKGRDKLSYLAYSSYSSQGYRIILYHEKSSYMLNTENIRISVRAMTIANIIICISMIILAVMLNYKSFRSVIDKIRGYAQDEVQSQNKNELQYILSAFNGQMEENEKLKTQLVDQHALMLDHILEDILNGKSVSQQNMAQIKFDMPYIYVINMQMQDLQNTTSLIDTSREKFYAIEMYADGLFTIVFSVSDFSEKTKEKAIRKIKEIINQPNICLGCSSVYTEPSKLFLAYLEATRNLEKNKAISDGGCVKMAECSLPEEETQSTTKLTYAIKTGDSYAIEHANVLFDQISSGDNTPSLQRYMCYQIVELYRNVCRNLGISLDMMRISQTLQNSDVSLVRDDFISILREICDTQNKRQSEALEITYSKILQFINQKYTDPMFSMNDIADNFGISIYATSRMLKSILGINFRKYLNDMRIEHAKKLLMTTKQSVNDIAEMSGFTSSSYFISIFKSTEKVTPNKFRANN